MLCQAKDDEDPAAGFKDKVLEILYATDGNEEFEAPADDGTAPAEDVAGTCSGPRSSVHACMSSVNDAYACRALLGDTEDAELVEAPTADDEQTF